MDAGGSERAPAGAGGDLAVFEVAEELGPFGVGGDAVFLARPKCPPPGQERQMSLDRLIGVDRFIAESDVDVLGPGDDLGDVRGQPAHDRVSDEDPAEVMRGAAQRAAVSGGQAGASERGVEHVAGGACADPAVLGAEAALEQHR